MARAYLVVKYTLFVAIVLGAGLAIEHLTKIRRWMVSDALIQEEDLVYNVSSHLLNKNFETVLKKHYLRCLTNPSKPFCLLSANKRLEIFQSDQAGAPNAEVIEVRLKNASSDLHPRKIRIHSLLVVFTRFMKKYAVKVVLVEPSMLFCLLTSEVKYNMLTSGFNPSRLQGSVNVVTVGVLAEDAKKLEQDNLTKEMLSAGFKIVKLRKWIGHQSKRSFVIVHYFFILQDVAVHMVVFFPESTYLWHASLDTQGVDSKSLLFVNDGIFEKFALLPLNLDGASISRMFVPHDIRHFMQEMEPSKLVECRATSYSIIPSLQHPSLTAEQLSTRATISVKELKAILAPETVFFLLWSKSLLGWFGNCDIFHYSTSLELAVMRKSTEGLEFSDLLADNQFLRLENNTESDSGYEYKLTCHGLHINVFILHEDENLLTFKRREGQNTLKLVYPIFPMCSTHVFGEKIHVPCNADEILKMEFEKEYIDSILPNFANQSTFSTETGS